MRRRGSSAGIRRRRTSRSGRGRGASRPSGSAGRGRSCDRTDRRHPGTSDDRTTAGRAGCRGRGVDSLAGRHPTPAQPCSVIRFADLSGWLGQEDATRRRVSSPPHRPAEGWLPAVCAQTLLTAQTLSCATAASPPQRHLLNCRPGSFPLSMRGGKTDGHVGDTGLQILFEQRSHTRPSPAEDDLLKRHPRGKHEHASILAAHRVPCGVHQTGQLLIPASISTTPSITVPGDISTWIKDISLPDFSVTMLPRAPSRVPTRPRTLLTNRSAWMADS